MEGQTPKYHVADEVQKFITPEAQAGIDEMNKAMSDFASAMQVVTNGPGFFVDPNEVLHRKAKERRAKRKRGGKK